MKLLPLRLCAGLTVGLAFFTGCAETSSSPQPVVAAPAAPEPSAPAAPAMADSSMPAPATAEAPARLKYLRETPMPPDHIRVVLKAGKAPEGRVVLVDAPPPVPQAEDVPPHPPGPHHVWLQGHWRYYGGHYVWIGGRWEIPPAPEPGYVPPHWDARGSEHLFVEGYWQII